MTERAGPAITPGALAAVFAEAAAAHPAECCGWIAGPREAGLPAHRVRPAANARADQPGAFAFADPDLLAFHLAFDGDEPPRTVYHSHPGGDALLSATDRALALDPRGARPLVRTQHLVVALDADGAPREARLHAWDEDLGGFVEVARFAAPRRGSIRHRRCS